MAADVYDRYMGRYGPSLAASLIRFAGVEPGMRALDVGCGTGLLTAALAEQLGAGNVAAVDPSEPFAEACRRRVPGAEVVTGTAERLPFPDAAFDVALSQLVVNFMADAEQGVAEMTRVTRPGGVVAACVWDYAGEMPLLRAFWGAAHEVDAERAAESDEAFLRFGSPDELSDLWSSAAGRRRAYCAAARTGVLLGLRRPVGAASGRRRSRRGVHQVAGRRGPGEAARRLPAPPRRRRRAVRAQRTRVGRCRDPTRIALTA